MRDIDALLRDLDGLDVETQPQKVKRRSRDFYWYSPVLKRQLDHVTAEAVVTPTLTLALVVDLAEHAVAPFAAYEQQVLPLLRRHGGRLDRRLRTADGRTEVHLLSFADRAGYDAYLADPDRTAAAHLLDGLDSDDLRRRLLELTDAGPE